MALALVIVVVLLVCGAYIMIRYLSVALVRNTIPKTRDSGQRLEPSALGFALWSLLVIASCPWLASPILGDPVPPDLRTASAITASPALELSLTRASTGAPEGELVATPTAKAEPISTPSPTFRPPTPRPPAVTGVAMRSLRVYQCPGNDPKHATSEFMSAGTKVRVIGWNESQGSAWYLIEDSGTGPQKWISGSVRLDPPNYYDYIRRVTCRITR